MDVDEMLLALDQPEHKPLPNGVDLWSARPILSNAAGWRNVERRVPKVCENCGKAFTVHPSHASRAHACSTTCRVIMFYKRQRGEVPPRQLWNDGHACEAALLARQEKK